MDRERLMTAAKRLWRRGEDSGTNMYKSVLSHFPDGMSLKSEEVVERYNEIQEKFLKRQQDALDEFHAAVLGECPCGKPVKYPHPRELSDGKAVSRYCDCGRDFVIG